MKKEIGLSVIAMKKKIVYSFCFLILSIMVASTAFATTYVHEYSAPGWGWTDGEVNTGGDYFDYGTDCGVDSNYFYKGGYGTQSTAYLWGKYENINHTSDSTYQYQVNIPSCKGNATVSYSIKYGNAQSTSVSVNQAMYSSWVSLGSYFVKSTTKPTITLTNYHIGSYVVAWDAAAFVTN